MSPESLLASAGINIGLATILLCLFSILRKQHSNSNIYYARRLSLNHPIPFERSLRRFLPSVDWIKDAVKVSEDEILCNSGLDALVFVRFFKFGLALLFVFFFSKYIYLCNNTISLFGQLISLLRFVLKINLQVCVDGANNLCLSTYYLSCFNYRLISNGFMHVYPIRCFCK